MRYLGVSIAAGVCLLAAGAANAEERLADSDLDQVVAGFDLSQVTASDIFGLSIEPLVRDASLTLGLIILDSDVGAELDQSPELQSLTAGLVAFGVGPNPRLVSGVDPASGLPIVLPLDRPAPITNGLDTNGQPNVVFSGSLLVPVN